MFKKLLLIICIVSPFTVIHSQDHHLNKTHKNDSYDEKGEFEEGDIFVSALFGFDSETKGNEKDIAVEFSGRLGYLFSNTLTGGIKLSLDNEIIEGTLHKNIDVSHTLIGLFGRYDFTPGHKFSIFGELGFDYLSSKSKDGNLEIKENGYKIGLSPGITYFLNKHFAIEAFWGALQYQTKKVNGEHESTHEFNIGIDFEHINFGLAYKF